MITQRHSTKGRQLTWFVVKLMIAAACALWLVRSERLNVGRLRQLIDEPTIAVVMLAYFFVISLVSCGWRWYALLRVVDIPLKWTRVMLIQWIGLFFNLFGPGAVGGDLAKAVYVVKSADQVQIAKALAALAVDRFLGLLALFAIGALAIATQWHSIMSIPGLRQTALLVVLGFVVLLGLFSAIFLNARYRVAWIERFLAGSRVYQRPLRRLHEAFIMYASAPQTLCFWWGVSLLNQGCFVVSIWILSRSIVSVPVDVVAMGGVLPICAVLTALPFAPGGLSVGHIAFDRMFALAGWDHGADVFNLFFVMNLVGSLSGLIPYLLVRKQATAVQKATSLSEVARLQSAC